MIVMSDIKLRVYRLPAKTTVRILIDHDGTARPILWLKVGTDGSVYLGLSRPVGSLGYGGGNANSLGEVQVKYNDAKEISDPEFRKRIHLSFHSSGVINLTGMRWQRGSWRQLTQPHQLCLFLLEHPSRFPPASGSRKWDLIVKYPVDNARPIHGKLLVLPKGTIVDLKEVVHQVRLVFDVSGLVEVPAMYVELVLGHGLTGPWPQRTSIAWRSTIPGAGPS
jgi:hypothetical protein